MKKAFLSLFLLFFLSLNAEAQWTQIFKVTATSGGGGIYFSPGGLWLVSSGDNTPIKFYSSLDTGKTWTPHTITNTATHLNSGASISATLVNNDTVAASNGLCGMITVSSMNTPGTDQFIVRTYAGGSGCSESPRRFMFKVIGRP